MDQGGGDKKRKGGGRNAVKKRFGGGANARLMAYQGKDNNQQPKMTVAAKKEGAAISGGPGKMANNDETVRRPAKQLKNWRGTWAKKTVTTTGSVGGHKRPQRRPRG